MKGYTYSEVRKRLAEVLDTAKKEEVIIRRKGGDTFSLSLKKTEKRRLLIIAGAGASVEFGMPSVQEIDELFEEWNKKVSSNLYVSLRERIAAHRCLNAPKPIYDTPPNYEEVLRAATFIASSGPQYGYDNPYAAFLRPCLYDRDSPIFAANEWEYAKLASDLEDQLLKEFRQRCGDVRNTKQNELDLLKQFLAKIRERFQLGIVTLNHDNLFKQALPDLETGFDEDTGLFQPERLSGKSSWNFIHHLHGSVHFDMRVSGNELHVIHWNANLKGRFESNSSGRNRQEGEDSTAFPTSVLVMGGSKLSQILREPFLSYFLHFSTMVHDADAILILGYGFGDFHVNETLRLAMHRHRQRPVVVADWADDTQDSLQFRSDPWTANLFRAIPANAHEMSQEGHCAPTTMREQRANRAFEVSSNEDYPLAVWYNGFLEGCKDPDKIIRKLI